MTILNKKFRTKRCDFFFQLQNKNEQNTFHNDYYFSPSSCDNEFRERKITNKLVVVLALEGLSSEIFVLLLFFFFVLFLIFVSSVNVEMERKIIKNKKTRFLEKDL